MHAVLFEVKFTSNKSFPIVSLKSHDNHFPFPNRQLSFNYIPCWFWAWKSEKVQSSKETRKPCPWNNKVAIEICYVWRERYSAKKERRYPSWTLGLLLGNGQISQIFAWRRCYSTGENLTLAGELVSAGNSVTAMALLQASAGVMVKKKWGPPPLTYCTRINFRTTCVRMYRNIINNSFMVMKLLLEVFRV